MNLQDQNDIDSQLEHQQQLILWALDHNFEYIPINKNDISTGWDQRDKEGIPRLIEALECNMWSSINRRNTTNTSSVKISNSSSIIVENKSSIGLTKETISATNDSIIESGNIISRISEVDTVFNIPTNLDNVVNDDTNDSNEDSEGHASAISGTAGAFNNENTESMFTDFESIMLQVNS